MTISGTLKCSTCGNKIRIRYQVGCINPMIVREGCRKCGKLIKGTIDQKSELFDFGSDEFDSSYTETNQTISISTELPIPKKANQNGFAPLTPFMALVPIMGGFEKIKKFGYEIKSLQNFYDDNFDNFSLLNELLQNDSINYLLEEAKKKFRNSLSLEFDGFDEYSSVVNEVINDFFKHIETNYYKQNYRDVILSDIFEPNKTKISDLRDLSTQLNQYIDLKAEYRKGVALINRFLTHIKSFLPVVVLAYNNDYTKEYGDELKITTFDFLELKELYVEQFEFLTRLSSLHFGLLNLAERNDFDDFGIIPDCNILEDYQKKDNGSKKEVIKKANVLNDYFINTLNSQIRNGLGHLKTKYDPVTHEITYYPYKDKAKINRSKSIYLIDFAYLVFQQILKVRDTLFLIQKFGKAIK